MKLVIAEKPDLGRAIAAAISGEKNFSREKIEVKAKTGDHYVITWCFGHMLQIKPPEAYDTALKQWKLDDLPIYFENWEFIYRLAIKSRK